MFALARDFVVFIVFANFCVKFPHRLCKCKLLHGDMTGDGEQYLIMCVCLYLYACFPPN